MKDSSFRDRKWPYCNSLNNNVSQNRNDFALFPYLSFSQHSAFLALEWYVCISRIAEPIPKLFPLGLFEILRHTFTHLKSLFLGILKSEKTFCGFFSEYFIINFFFILKHFFVFNIRSYQVLFVLDDLYCLNFRYF